MILSLSYRNLNRNRRQSFVIFCLFALLITLFYIGNSLIAESGEGLKTSYRRNFTGDLVIKSPTEMEVSLFGAVTPSMGDYYVMPPLEDREDIQILLDISEAVEGYTGLSSGAAVAQVKDVKVPLPLFGVEGDSYFRMFPGLKVLAGEALDSEEEGVMLSNDLVRRITEQTGDILKIGAPVLLSMGGNRGFKIREVPLKGIFEYDTRNPELDRIALCDMKTLNILNSLALAEGNEESISDSEMSLMDEDLFGDLDELFADDLGREDEADASIGVEDVMGIFDADDSVSGASGEWHFILVRLKDDVRINDFIRDLEGRLAERGIHAEIMNWREAAGLSARMVFLLQLLYNAGFILVLLAGGVAIVNILLISVFDRYAEIGTLRAIGAPKPWVALLILTENMTLAFCGGLVGLLLGSLLIPGINLLHLRIDNTLVQTLLGMKTVDIGSHPDWAWGSVGVSILLGLVASWIPVSRAQRILPTDALRRSGL
jgi:putative ABC transport system permease protein